MEYLQKLIKGKIISITELSELTGLNYVSLNQKTSNKFDRKFSEKEREIIRAACYEIATRKAKTASEAAIMAMDKYTYLHKIANYFKYVSIVNDFSNDKMILEINMPCADIMLYILDGKAEVYEIQISGKHEFIEAFSFAEFDKLITKIESYAEPED